MSGDVTAEISSTLKRLWWLNIARGVLLVILGLIMLSQPTPALKALVWVMGVYAIVDGVVVVGIGLANRKEPGAGWFMLEGLVGLVMGVIVVAWPGATVKVLFYLMVIWLLGLGVFSVIAAVRLYRAQDFAWTWVMTFGLITGLFGLLLLTRPQQSLAVVGLILGLFAFSAGVVSIIGGYAARTMSRQLHRPSALT